MMPVDTSQRISAVGGLALVLLVQLEVGEVLKTVILAAVGGTTSYLFTLALKFLLLRLRKKKKEK